MEQVLALELCLGGGGGYSHLVPTGGYPHPVSPPPQNNLAGWAPRSSLDWGGTPCPNLGRPGWGYPIQSQRGVSPPLPPSRSGPRSKWGYPHRNGPVTSGSVEGWTYYLMEMGGGQSENITFRNPSYAGGNNWYATAGNEPNREPNSRWNSSLHSSYWLAIASDNWLNRIKLCLALT